MSAPRILLLDIETAPHLVYAWGLWKQTININNVIESGRTICWSAKWLGDKKQHFMSEHHDGEEAMLQGIWDLLDEADFVITYNGNSFDLPTLNKEFVKAEMPPPATYRSIDLIATVRKQFRFASTKLDFVCQELDLGHKVRHAGMSLWHGCMAGDAKSWRTMKAYNKEDVGLLERLYVKLLPWIKNHPNWGPFMDDSRPTCRNCGSNHVIKKGVERTNTGTYQRYRCGDCRKPLKGRTMIKGQPKATTV